MTTNKIHFKNRNDFLAKRATLDTFGGSDCSTIMGLNKWKSPVRFFYQSVGLVESSFTGNSHTFHGTNLENYVIDLWKHYETSNEVMMMNYEMNRKVNRCRAMNCFQVHPDMPWLHATIDAKILKCARRSGQGILECKTASTYAADMYNSVNPSYVLQLQQYMMILGLRYGEIAQLVGGFDFELYTIDESTEIQSAIYEETMKFHEVVQEGKKIMKKRMNQNQRIQELSQLAPEIDHSDSTKELLSELHQVRDGEAGKMGWTDEILELVLEYDEARKGEKVAVLKKQTVSNKLKGIMLENDVKLIELPEKGKVTWNKNLSIKPPVTQKTT